MDISNINSYEDFEIAFEDYRKELISQKAQARSNEYFTAVEAVESFKKQLETVSEEQFDIVTEKLAYWESHRDNLLVVEPNITDPSKITIILTEEEEQALANTKVQFKKALRTKLVDEIVVNVNDNVFDGDETSQLRMTRAIQLLINDTDTVSWVLSNNQSAIVTKLELIEALQKAAAAQISLWDIY